MLRADEVNRETIRIEENFGKWLQMSRLDYEEFLECRTMTNFQLISSYIDDGYNIIAVGSMTHGQFMQLGERFVYRSGDVNAFQDLALLLLYMAERLDSANKEAHSQQEKGYFFNRVKAFIQSAEDYRKNN